MALLRPARIEDAIEVARLAGELGYPVDEAAMAARLHAILALPLHRVTVAQGERDHLLGWIAVERRLTLESGERIEIVGLVVDAAARGGGVGRALVADAEQWAREQGLDTIVVRSSVARARSHTFYLGGGYRLRKTQHVYAKTLD